MPEELGEEGASRLLSHMEGFGDLKTAELTLYVLTQ